MLVSLFPCFQTWKQAYESPRMDALLKALAHEARRRLIRELRKRPGLKHNDLLNALGMARDKRGQLTKLLDELEQAGLVERADGVYRPVAPDAMGQLLSKAAEVNLAAQRLLAARAALNIKDAEHEAEELRCEAAE